MSNGSGNLSIPDEVDVWTVGTNANWSEYHDGGLIAIGWNSDDPSMAGVTSPDEVAERSPGRDPSAEETGNSRDKMLYRFVDEIEVGDIIIAKTGVNTPQGVGIVASDYEFCINFSLGDDSDRHVRRINWMVNLNDFENELTLEDHRFAQNSEVTRKSDSYRELVALLEEQDSSRASFSETKLSSVPKLAAAHKTHCAKPEEVDAANQQFTQLYQNYGSNSSFVDNLKDLVESPLSEDQRQSIKQELDSLPSVRDEIKWALESDHLTAWGTDNLREFHAIAPGDWIAHVDGNGSATIRFLQRVDVVLDDIPEAVRERIAESLLGSEKYSDIILSTTPVLESDYYLSEFEEDIRDEAQASDIFPFLYDIAGFFQQVNCEVIRKGGGAETILESIFGNLPSKRPPVPAYNDGALLIPAGLRTNGDTGRSSQIHEALQGSRSQFLLTVNSGEYDDDISERYHFKEGIPGYNQLLTANENSDEVPFAAIEKQADCWAVVAVGTIGDIQLEKILDGNKHWTAKTRRIEWVDPIRFDAVDPLIDKGEIRQRGINEVQQQELELILNWHHGPGTTAVTEIKDHSASDLLKRAFAHLVSGRNVIFYGPPGTGKTWAARQLSKAVCGKNQLAIETANAEWTNYDMVGGWAPGPAEIPDESPGEKSNWHPSPGIITDVAVNCAENLDDTGRPSWLLIDEMNRANLDQAFGDVFTLLDLEYRASKPLKYANKSQILPYSFRILATQNTYDLAKLFSLGYAFRRRFAFLEVPSKLDITESASVDSNMYDTSELSTDTVLAQVSPTDSEEITSWAVNRLRYDKQENHESANAPVIDPRALFPQFASPPRIDASLDAVRERDMGLAGDDFIDTVLALAVAATEREIIEVGRAIVMDIVAYVIAYELAFPGEVDQTTVDHACCAYLVPQFENVMGKLRQAEALSQDNALEAEFKNIIALAAKLELSETARRLADALESHSILG